MNILQSIQQSLYTTIKQQYPDLDDALLQNCTFDLQTDAQKSQFGDIATNAAMILARSVQSNPRTVAQTIVDHFSHPLIEKIEIAGPGFLNFYFTKQAYNDLFKELCYTFETYFKLSDDEKKLQINLEFVSANPTGPLHFGHGRNGIVGDVLARILGYRGHNVTKEFYINDAGEQIRKLGVSFKIRIQQALGQNIDLPEDAYHGEYLQTLAAQFIQEQGAQGLEKDQTFLENYAKNHLLDALKATLESYGITFTNWFSEKTLHDSGAIKESLQILQKNGYLYEQDGATWFRSTQFGDDKDRVIVKADGSLTYIAADAAYVQNKLARGYDKLIMVLGHDHHSFVNRLHGILQAFGHDKEKLDVILYQLVRILKDGAMARMSKRAGTIVGLQDIIDVVGKDVARFFYLNRKVDAELEFDVDLALQTSNENPVYYIQYAYVRTHSIINKAKSDFGFTPQVLPMQFTQEEELIVKKIMSLQTVLTTIENTYQTHLLAYYTYELAHLFHKYYNSTKVIVENDQVYSESRLGMIFLIQATLGLCCNLMGIGTPEKM
ncbi:arginine--tRNA ligase [bacterium]|nr:arginine--tRNA ligase [bacterium]